MSVDAICEATNEALLTISEPRFFHSERAFQARFYYALVPRLQQRALLDEPRVLETEYQKRAIAHGMQQRPDIILHVPAEDAAPGTPVNENNFAVWALKLRATVAKAREDFDKLDEMVLELNYPVGIFINIGEPESFAGEYRGQCPDRVRMVATWQDPAGVTHTKWGA